MSIRLKEHIEYQEHVAGRRCQALRELRLASRLWRTRTSKGSLMYGYEGSLKDFLLRIARLRCADAYSDGPLGQGMVLTWEKIIKEIEDFKE